MDEPRSSGCAGLGRLVTALLPTLCAVLLIGLAFWMVATRAVELEIHTHPSVLVVNAIPVALSEMVFAHSVRYTTLSSVRAQFEDRLPASFNAANISSFVSGKDINPAIRKVLDMDRAKLGTNVDLLGPDDKGIVDLVKLGFTLFGYRVENVTVAYFAILLASCLAYVLAFRRSPSRLLLLAAFLAMLYLVLPMVAYNKQLGSILMLRAMPVLSMVACLHVLLFMANTVRERASLGQIGLLVVQVGVIAFTLHLKTSTIWQVMAIVAFGLAVLIVAVVRKAPSPNPSPVRGGGEQATASPPLPRKAVGVGGPMVGVMEGAGGPWGRRRSRCSRRAAVRGPMVGWRGPPRSTALAVGLACSLTLAGYFAIQWYQGVALQEYHRQGVIATRVFWHNIFSGLSFHPAFAERYQIRVDDSSIFAATRDYLTETDRYDAWREMGGEEPGFAGLKLDQYDPYVREMLFARCTTYVRECAEAVLYYKPVALAENLAWLYGLRALPPNLEIVVSRSFGEAGEQVMRQYLSATSQMDQRGQRAYLWTPIVLLIVAPFAVLLMRESRASTWTAGAGAVGLLLGSTIPTVIGYPVAHTILEPAIAFGVLLYFGICAAVAAWLPGLLARGLPRRRAPETTSPVPTAAR